MKPHYFSKDVSVDRSHDSSRSALTHDRTTTTQLRYFDLQALMWGSDASNVEHKLGMLIKAILKFISWID
jgi:hypothetical protein